jgi:2-octaprenylphenol hydroxylase
MSVWDGEGNGSIAFHSADIHSPHLGYIVENSILLKVLRNKLEQFSHVQFLAPAHVEAMSLASSKSLLRLRGGQSITADFIVGADGANSVLRTLADIKAREWSYGHKAIVTTVRVEKPHQNTAWQRFSHQGPLAFLPLQGNAGSPDHEAHYCSIVWSLEDKASEQMMALAEDEFCHELSKTFEYRLGSVDWSDERHCIPLRQRNALSYGVSGFALVGDAAHTIHPLAGLGVNLGLADVQSLSAEILRAHMRKVPLQHPSIVKRYQRSRKPQNLLTMAAMEGFKQLFGHSSLSAQSIRNRGMDWVDSSAWLKRWIVEEIAR